MMKRLVLTLAVSLGLTAALPGSVAADISLTDTNQAVLSCNDGHSGVLWVDSTTLTSLAAEVASINTSATGLSCTLDTVTIDPSSKTTDWTVYDYNPSNRALAPRNSPNKMPATTPDGGVTWEFPFKPDIYSALFTTTDRSVTGNDLGKTLTDTITVNGDAASFKTQHGGGDCVGDTPAAVRFYFTSPRASGPSPHPPGSPPAGFYTQFWWSDAQHMDLVNGTLQTQMLTESMTPGDWSDWDGTPATAIPATFAEAASHVQSIGLSFGGECFFETGVTPTPNTFTNEQFSSTFSAN
jgi:hypothetical protein